MYTDVIRNRLKGAFLPFKVRTTDGRIFSVPSRERAWVPPTGGGKVVFVDQMGFIIIVQAPDIAAVEDEVGALKE